MRRLIVISGAGLSVESGIRAFRTADNGKSLWDEYDLNEVCNIGGFDAGFHYRNDPMPPLHAISSGLDGKPSQNLYHYTHEFYNKRRQELSTVEPNLAHLRIGEWYKRYLNGQVINLTTNVDDLLERGGVPKDKVLHIHGFLREIVTKDTNRNRRITDVGYTEIDPNNFEWVKPNVVFFGEAAPAYQEMYDVLDTLTSQDMVILVGCSNIVINFMWDLFPAVKRGTKLLVVNYYDSVEASKPGYAGMTRSDMYQLEENGIPYWSKGAVDAFSDPRFIRMVETHLEGATALQSK